MKYEDILIGDTASFKHTITEKDVELFAKISGDKNPLHFDENFAKKADFSGKIVHGMLAGSLFSKLVGMHLPGRCIYVSQELEFKNPITPNTEIIIEGRVIKKIDVFRLVTIETNIKDPLSNKKYITGKARVKVLNVD
ncbi:MaoC family dehydratase [Candidatus Woesearchaeota archaeon]|nr:MaoC family dehydratase [Candidatus Woesearchaeota archaeon]